MGKTIIRNQDLANEFLNDERYQKNLLYCVSYDLFYFYEDGWYRQVSSREFSEMVWSFVCNKYPELNVRSSMIVDLITQIKWGAYRKREDMDTPYIAFKDRLFNMDTFKPEDFDREKVATFRLSFGYEVLDMQIPLWNEFLKSTLVHDYNPSKEEPKTDEELLNLVQEIFGYYLINNLKAQKVFFLVGNGANGKSVMINILENMIGYDFISAMSLQFLTTDQFATSNLIGKKVNICSEEESKYLRSDKFKALISGDLIDAGRKFEGRIAFRPSTKYLFASNVLPTFEGFNYGMKRRIIIIPFYRTFKDKEQDKGLSEKLKKELPGIIAWAIDGARRLVKNNYIFSESVATHKTSIELENYISSALMFFRENYTEKGDDLEFVLNERLYEEYVKWCEKNGKKRMSSHVFLKDIRNNVIIDEVISSDGMVAPGRGMYMQKIVLEEIDPFEEADKIIEQM